MTRFVMSIGNLVFAFFLGAVVLVITAIQFPAFFEMVLNGAEYVKMSLNSLIPVSEDGRIYKNLVRYFIEEQQLVFMFFVIVARIILSFFMWVFGRVLGLSE